ncbi:unnamed protein product [Schistosoma curassoni]|uniref:Uncharacterized protein n=1 Tax=Schistosoma curassoni TaxID=6186 RepID=A0A183KRJ2_9TREM|nr:unnamed protein product [Schistosoma curassoni]
MAEEDVAAPVIDSESGIRGAGFAGYDSIKAIFSSNVRNTWTSGSDDGNGSKRQLCGRRVSVKTWYAESEIPN